MEFTNVSSKFKTEYDLLTEQLNEQGKITQLSEDVSSQILQEIYGPDQHGETRSDITQKKTLNMIQSEHELENILLMETASEITLAGNCIININADDYFRSLNGFNTNIGKVQLISIIQRVIDTNSYNSEGLYHVIKNPLQKVCLVFGKTADGERIYLRLINMGGFAELRVPINSYYKDISPSPKI